MIFTFLCQLALRFTDFASICQRRNRLRACKSVYLMDGHTARYGRSSRRQVPQATSAVSKQADEVRLHVGSYSEAGGRGVYPLTLAPGGSWALGEPFVELTNASFGAYSTRFDLHYIVDEADDGAVYTTRRGPAGWEVFARAPTLGSKPCHVALDDKQASLAVANYASGDVAVYSVDSHTGVLQSPPRLLRNAGHGPDSERQEGPHAHCAAFSSDSRWLYWADLGTDEVFRADLKGGDIETAWSAPPGSGPRQLLLHPRLPLALLLCELASTLTLFDVVDGTLAARQTLSTLPGGFAGESLGGHLALNAAGDRVYATNRGHDSIAVFTLDAAGTLVLLDHVPCGGASPRFFLLLEEQRLLVLANEEAGNITTFEITTAGRLSPQGVVAEVPGAAFLLQEQAPSQAIAKESP